MNWKYSSLGVRSIAHALELSGKAPQVRARVPEETRQALASPHLHSWHDGSVVVDVTVAVLAELGAQGVEQLFFAAVKRSLGPVMEPFLRVVLTLGGSKPETMFARMNENLQPVMKGVTTEWTQTGPSRGELTVVHTDEMNPDAAFAAWAGSIRYSFDLCRVAGKVQPRRPSPDNRRFTFELSW